MPRHILHWVGNLNHCGPDTIAAYEFAHSSSNAQEAEAAVNRREHDWMLLSRISGVGMCVGGLWMMIDGNLPGLVIAVTGFVGLILSHMIPSVQKFLEGRSIRRHLYEQIQAAVKRAAAAEARANRAELENTALRLRVEELEKKFEVVKSIHDDHANRISSEGIPVVIVPLDPIRRPDR